MTDETKPPSYSESHPSDRPGVFHNLENLIRPWGKTPRKPALSLAFYKRVTTANPEVGDIIHILEDNHETTGPRGSCLHQRVTLVIRHDTPVKDTCRAMTCVPLCRHPGADTSTSTIQSHWDVGQVLKDGTRLQDKADSSSPALVIQFGQTNHFLLPGVMVNLAEIWHVEYDDIRIRDLGKVPWKKNLDVALARVVELFRETVLPKAVVSKKGSGR